MRGRGGKVGKLALRGASFNKILGERESDLGKYVKCKF